MKSEDIYRKLGIDPKIIELISEGESSLSGVFEDIEKTKALNTLKVITAMQEEKVSSECMEGSSGYGYSDIGRDTLEKVYARIFLSEDALVRSQIISGTHALSIALFALLRPGDELFAATGLPYDTLQTVIGLSGAPGSLAEIGVNFSSSQDGFGDLEAIENGISERTKLVLIQRSRGYSDRKSLSVDEIGDIISSVRSVKKDILVLVDNCYGEYVEEREPIEAGADLVAGSLIKNPGGGIAPVGGYIAGRKDLIKLCAARMTAPGLYREAGPSIGLNRLFYQGTYLAPMVTANALRTAALSAYVYEKLGFRVSPRPFEKRSDTITAICLGDRKKLLSFVRGIQSASAVDSFIEPVPAPMPGYPDEIVMASGSFVQGSSIELSADAPLRPPFSVFLQGGLSYEGGKLGIMKSVSNLVSDGLIFL